MIKKIIITGGCGFIGSEIIRKYLMDKEILIFNIDKKEINKNQENLERLLNERNDYRLRYKFINCNICDYRKLSKIIFGINPDLIIHLAAETHVDRSIDNPKSFVESNIIGTFNLIEIIRNYLMTSNNRLKLIHVSTDEVFGSLGSEGKFNELSPYKPNSPYSASKASSDHLVKAWQRTYNLPFLVTNCSNNYGPWQFPEKLIPLAIFKALKNQKIPIYGNGKQIRDWLHVSDHADAIIKIAELGEDGSNYCIGGNSEKTNIETVRLICEFLDELAPSKSSYKNLITFVQDRPGHDSRYAIDSNKLKKELNWEPKFNFEKGLKETVAWYLKNQDWCNSVLMEANYKTERLGIKNN